MGVRNNYRSGMPVPEAFFKDLAHGFKALKHFFLHGFKVKTIYVFPDYPSKKTSIFKVADVIKNNLTNGSKKNARLYVYWEDKTLGNPDKYLSEGDEQKKILNYHCRDISKEKVDAAIQKVFGYSTFVRPNEFVGKAVEKSDINAMHDGRTVELPLTDTEPGKIYQILIDNSISEEEVLDYRIPIVEEALDFVYLKYKKREIRFDNVTYKVEMKDATAVFSADEIRLINEFAKEFELNYGELDILRDKQSKKIYIIDVNKTPYGPPAGLDKENSKIAIERTAKKFKQAYL
ncbi:MAG: hypothetical protein AB8F74_10790 [Saprospiraceae bacterium]